MKKLLIAAAAVFVSASTTSAATIDLTAQGLQLTGDPIASSSTMSIVDVPTLDLGFLVIPGFFQALDATSDPVLELNTGDGSTFNLSITPGSTGLSTETARDGDTQLELLFALNSGSQAFGRLTLAAGDSLDNLLTGSSFGPASFSVWSVEAVSTTIAPVPTPAGFGFLLAGIGGLAFVRSTRREMP